MGVSVKSVRKTQRVVQIVLAGRQTGARVVLRRVRASILRAATAGRQRGRRWSGSAPNLETATNNALQDTKYSDTGLLIDPKTRRSADSNYTKNSCRQGT